MGKRMAIFGFLGFIITGGYIAWKKDLITFYGLEHVQIEGGSIISGYCPQMTNEEQYDNFLKKAGETYNIDWLFGKTYL